MRLRPVLWAALLVAAFVLVTGGVPWNFGGLLAPARQAGKAWTAPETARSAGLSADETNNIEIYKAANPATVNITSTVWREGWFFELYPEQGTGSGFLVSPDGRILTNHHVVSGTAQLQVTLANQKKYRAKLLASDPPNDLALIKIEPRDRLPFLKLGDSDPVQVGQKVLAIGNPFGFDGTLTTGIVSSIGRSLRDERGRTLEEMIQTDAAINPGNSGGPLLDSHGSVIGVNTAIYGAQGNIGIGFAMPVNRAKPMLEDVQSTGRFERPTLGVSAVYVAGDLAESLNLPAEGGLLIQQVTPGSPAEAAGLRGASQVVIVGNYRLGVGGDLITAVDGRPVESDQGLQRSMSRKRAGDTLNLTIFRGGRTRRLQVRLSAGAATL
ncbi:MAG: trypsin-like serine protease [Acidobacteria bacterium]|nr:trypsin-like serine protease [Acidobacteriota bacterium]